MGSGQGNDTLMGMGGGHLVQLPAVNRDNDSTGILGLGSQTLQGLVRIAGGDEDLVNGAACLQGFVQGITALQLTLDLLHGSAVGKAVSPALSPVGALRSAVLFVHSKFISINRLRGDGGIIRRIPIDVSIIADFFCFHN